MINFSLARQKTSEW